MVIAYHLIWTAYGWWLPNDPRGSMSHVIESDVIAELGVLHFGRKRVQPTSAEIRAFYSRAVDVLKFPLLTISLQEQRAVADAFARVVRSNGYTCYACTIMPDHVHVLIRKHKDRTEQMISNLQQGSAARLHEVGLRRTDHPVWGGPGWKVYLEDREDIERTIRYIENNPIKCGQTRQAWGCVTPYDGWAPKAVRVVRRRRD